jgi:hypothetical protein
MEELNTYILLRATSSPTTKKGNYCYILKAKWSRERAKCNVVSISPVLLNDWNSLDKEGDLRHLMKTEILLNLLLQVATVSFPEPE